MKLRFEVHRLALTSAVLETIHRYLELHGANFKRENLRQMSQSLDDAMGEVLMFGADIWPAEPEIEPSGDSSNVMPLFRTANPTRQPSRLRVAFARATFWLRLFYVRFTVWMLGLVTMGSALFPKAMMRCCAALHMIFCSGEFLEQAKDALELASFAI